MKRDIWLCKVVSSTKLFCVLTDWHTHYTDGC